MNKLNSPEQTTSGKEEYTKPERLASLDILRGYDMFWITGGEGLIGALATASGWGFMQKIEHQMHHAEWEGFRFFDLIFPLFIFMMGVSIPFALTSRLKKEGGKKAIYRKVFRRFVILVVFGVIYNQTWLPDWTNPRIASVLGQIGFAYFFASIIFVKTQSIKGIAGWALGILIVYGLVQNFFPVPGHGAGVLTQEGSVNAFVDQYLTPGRLLGGTFEPEGFLNCISAISIGLMGALAGLVLRNTAEPSQYKKFITLLAIGAVCIAIALPLSSVYPFIKNAWTSSFNLLVGGISFMLLGIFYWIVDILKFQKWGFYFKVIGMNSITVYMGVAFISFWGISKNLLEGITMHMGDWGNVLLSIGQLAIIWYSLYLMYKNKIFLRI